MKCLNLKLKVLKQMNLYQLPQKVSNRKLPKVPNKESQRLLSQNMVFPAKAIVWLMVKHTEIIAVYPQSMFVKLHVNVLAPFYNVTMSPVHHLPPTYKTVCRFMPVLTLVVQNIVAVSLFFLCFFLLHT